MPTNEQRVAVLDTLRQHGHDPRKTWTSTVCRCGWGGTSAEHDEHVADAVVDALEGVGR